MDSAVYYPILRWKRGEQIAMRHLSAADRGYMFPIAEVQQLEPGHLQPKLRRQLAAASAETYPIAIDIKQPPAPTPYGLLARIVMAMQGDGLHVWPALRAADVLADLAGVSALRGVPGVVLRIEALTFPMLVVPYLLAELRKALGQRVQIHVVVDLYAIGDTDLAALAGIAAGFVQLIRTNDPAALIAVAGGSFPLSLQGLKPGVANKLPRKELEVWKAVRNSPGGAGVRYGDYGVTNPLPLGDIDPTKMNPSAAIRYALHDHWWLLRASGIRTQGKGGLTQYNALCQLLIYDPRYAGAAYSYGDAQYATHAQPGASSGNLMTWRRDATNHHLVYTVRQMVNGTV